MPPAQHSYTSLTRRALGKGLFGALTFIQVQRGSAQDHKRPYFMPPSEREFLHDLILKQSWAKTDYERIRAAASKGDGFAGAFLYALDGDLQRRRDCSTVAA